MMWSERGACEKTGAAVAARQRGRRDRSPGATRQADHRRRARSKGLINSRMHFPRTMSPHKLKREVKKVPQGAGPSVP